MKFETGSLLLCASLGLNVLCAIVSFLSQNTYNSLKGRYLWGLYLVSQDPACYCRPVGCGIDSITKLFDGVYIL